MAPESSCSAGEKVRVPDLNLLDKERFRSLGFSMSKSWLDSSVDETGETTLSIRKLFHWLNGSFAEGLDIDLSETLYITITKKIRG